MSAAAVTRDELIAAARALWGPENSALSKRDELRFGNNGSKKLDLKKQVWIDWEGTPPDDKGGYVKLCKLAGISLPRTNGGAGAPPEAIYEYCDEAGILLFQVLRFPNNKFLQRKPDGTAGWDWKLGTTRRVLYWLPELAAADPNAIVFIPEGEKDVDNLRALGLVATCNPQGACKWRKEFSQHLAGRDCVILPDNDDVGRKHAAQVFRALNGVARSVRVVELPGLGNKEDVSDWLDRGGTTDQLRQLINDASLFSPEEPEAEGMPPPINDPGYEQSLDEQARQEQSRKCRRKARGNSEDDEERIAQREQILSAVIDAKVTFWRDADGEGFATVPNGERIERYRIRSTAFKNIVRGIYGDAYPSKLGTPGAVSDNAWREARASFEAMAFRGEIRSPEVRLCQTEDGAIWIDLGDPSWRLVRVDRAGWRLIEKADVPLYRPDGVRPLPEPVAGDLSVLDRFYLLANLSERAHRIMASSWMVAALYPRGPYPILAVDGEDGSGKTTLCDMLRRLVDANKAPLRAKPRNEDDLVISASNGRVVGFDKVSTLSDDMADAICRLATGAGLGKRRLYTNDEEQLFEWRAAGCRSRFERSRTRNDSRKWTSGTSSGRSPPLSSGRC
jgi:hypothetical protein